MPKKAVVPPPSRLPHGALELPCVEIQGYSLALHESGGFLGDTVRRTAFLGHLDRWRKVFTDIHGKDPLGKGPAPDVSKRRLDYLLERRGLASAAILSAVEDYAVQLAYVARRFLRHKSWQGVQRIVVGGGFQQSGIGQRAVRRAGELLFENTPGVQLRTLHHHADEGGLIGWAHLAPPELLERYDGLLAVDIGGTNVRCGIVRTRFRKEPDLSRAKVVGRCKWSHAVDEDVARREDLVQGIVGMLEKLIRMAGREGISLAPLVGIACPGMIQDDGFISAGAQNLPGNWESERFHLPSELAERLPRIDGAEPLVQLHNDAVIQGLSELPYMKDVKRWAILTIGTGLGNVSYVNR